DLRSGRVVEAAGALHRPLLVLHSPIDNVVGVDHAAALFRAARHPRSFVSLDGADHLLGDVADAVYAAKTIGTWAERYLVDESGVKPPPPASAPVMVSETGQGKFLNHVVVGEHRFLADEPESMGGFDAGPSPYDLLGAALGACTSMTIRMYADHKGYPLGRVTVDVSHDKVHVDDAGNVVEGRDGKIDRFRRSITVDGDLDEQLRANVLRIADKCPVHRTLERTSRIETGLSE
ncbi:MAG: bifunctional alpha/beta hydrolase/OsmC family protein, partial [Ilumatobacter fluminis]